ncbi:MAG: UDP-N-acetylmuramoyl-L-alanine--D-glutamate ligase [Eubacterium sp.]|nr:UDP-N-acetylmuramoyl-L-alanine--D-glutamate ligase [Eubacterium sp.]
MDLHHKKFIVAGTGKSGIAAANLLGKIGSEVILYNSDENTDFDAVAKELETGVEVYFLSGNISVDYYEDNHIDVLVVSPGIPLGLDFIHNAVEAGVPVWSEIELAYVAGRGKVIGITGTNGKTTTTSLVGEIMESHFDDVRVVGNIGIPYTTTAFDSTDDTVTVAEISSFQLETVHSFNPNVSAILNITPDHLNRHGTMDVYTDCKMRIAKNQDDDEPVILNYEDEILRNRAKELTNKIVWFSSKQKVPCGVYLDGEDIVYFDEELNAEPIKVCNKNQTTLVGIHNLENIMAAVAIAINMEVPVEKIRESVKNFKAVPHRIEYVNTINDVIYYNDSKGTNTDASIKAIEAMSRPTVLIAGGYDKDSSFDEWADAFEGKVKCLVVLGQTADQISETVKAKGFENVIKVESLKEAVEKCYENAEPGDAVLLSPACASWGMFENYEQRGDMFKEFVNNLD